jgi:hypothetical protein
MHVKDTLELDYLIEQINDDTIDITSEPTSNSSSINYINRRTGIFDPSETGTHKLDINGQTIEIEVVKIPESGVLRWKFEEVSDCTINDSWYNNSGTTNANWTTTTKQGSYALDHNGTEHKTTGNDNLPSGVTGSSSRSLGCWVYRRCGRKPTSLLVG